MFGLAALMSLAMYVGLFLVIFYGIKYFKYCRVRMYLITHPKIEEDKGYKTLNPVDPSIVIEKHTLLSKINKMIEACESQLIPIKDNLKSSEDYQIQRELSAVIDSYKEIRSMEINDRISLNYATYLFNDGKLRSLEEINKYDDIVKQAKYISSGDFYKEIAECDEHTYFSRKILFSLLMFIGGFIPSSFYGVISDKGFWSGFFEWQADFFYLATHPFENGILGDLVGSITMLPYMICLPFFVGAFVMLHAGLEIEHNVKENICRKKAGMKPQINKNTIIAGVACIPTLIRILK